MRHLAIAAALIATPALAAPTPRDSWGKPGVSLADYRTDAVTCGRAAYYTDISGTNQAKAFVTASTRIDQLFDAAGNAGAGGHVSDDASNAQVLNYYGAAAREADAINPREKVAQLRQLLDAKLARCLTDHGYRRFRLTDDQRHRLAKFRQGSDARRDYLHSLAADPKVLAAQVPPPYPEK